MFFTISRPLYSAFTILKQYFFNKYCVFCISPPQDFGHPGYTPFSGLSSLLRQTPSSSPGRSQTEMLHAAGHAFLQHENSGAHPGLPLSAASIFFLLTGPIQASRHPALVSSRHGPL